MCIRDRVEIVGIRDTRLTTVTGVEMFRKLLDEGMAGDNVGLLLRGVQKEDIERGMVLVKKGSITPHTKFEGEVYVLKKEEGGRHTPFFAGYRPQFYIRTTDVTGQITAFTSDDGANVELRSISCKERRMSSTLFFFENINFSFKLSMRGNRSFLNKNHSSLNIFFLDTT